MLARRRASVRLTASAEPTAVHRSVARKWKADTTCKIVATALLALVVGRSSAVAQELPRGVVIDDVKCAAEPTESYALYLPSTYSPDRPWNLLMAFHPAARGRAMVE